MRFRALLVVVSLLLPARAFASPILMPTGIGEWTFSGFLTVNPFLATTLPELATGDAYTGVLRIEYLTESLPSYKTFVDITSGSYTWSAWTVASITQDWFGVGGMIDTGPITNAGFYRDFSFHYPTGGADGSFTAHYTVLPFEGHPNGAEVSVGGTFSGLTSVPEPPSLLLIAVGAGFVLASHHWRRTHR